MNEFKVGDRVRYMGMAGKTTGTPSTPHTSLTDHLGETGIVIKTKRDNGYGTAPTVQFEKDGLSLPIAESYLVAAPLYDQDTVNAIVKWLREEGWKTVPGAVEAQFSVPKTRTVSVNFQVPEGESVVDYLENVGIDYDIEGGN